MEFIIPISNSNFGKWIHNKEIIEIGLNYIKLNEVFVIMVKSLKPKVLVQWLTFLLRIQDILGSNIFTL
jgi:hypothetical protein